MRRLNVGNGLKTIFLGFAEFVFIISLIQSPNFIAFFIVLVLGFFFIRNVIKLYNQRIQ